MSRVLTLVKKIRTSVTKILLQLQSDYYAVAIIGADDDKVQAWIIKELEFAEDRAGSTVDWTIDEDYEVAIESLKHLKDSLEYVSDVSGGPAFMIAINRVVQHIDVALAGMEDLLKAKNSKEKEQEEEEEYE